MKTYFNLKQKLCIFVTLLAITLTNTVQASSPTDYFRSKKSGNWNTTSTWESSSDNINWVRANITPKYTANSITIQNADTVIITATDTIDQTVVNGMLIYSGGTLYVNNGSGIDIVVNGIIEDNYSTGITWLSSATWSLGSNGTIIKISNSNCNLWRDAYDGGISTIPATANWVFRKTTSTAPDISVVSMTYPNIKFENEYSSATWTINYAGSFSHPTFKGDINIGGNGTYNVILNNTNTNATKIKAEGGLLVKSGSTYRLYNNVGAEIEGNITIDGTIEFSTYTPTILLSGNDNQTIDGTAQTWKNVEIDKTSADKTVTLNEALTITSNLILTTGKIISSSSHLLIISDGATVTDASDDAFVAGPVKKTGNDAFIFPVGKSSNYQPISISAPSNAAATFIAEYFDSGQTYGNDRESTLDTLNSCEYWELDTVGTAYPVIVTLGWDTSSCNITEQGLMRVARWDGSEWEDLGNATSDAETAKSVGPVNYFGPFILGVSKASNMVIVGPAGYCSGEEIELMSIPINPVGTENYSWSDGSGVIATTQVLQVTPTSTTTYSVIFTDDYNWIKRTITVQPIPSNICNQCIVRNGDFEYHQPTLLTNAFGNLNETGIWYDGNRDYNGADHFHSDYTGTVDVPTNNFGTEDDHTSPGDNLGGYAGFISHYPFPEVREYISSKLNCELESGQLYDISFWASLGDAWTLNGLGIGLFLSTTNTYTTFPNLYSLTPQLYATTPTGATGWTELSLNNYSGNGEGFITIGNFLDDTETLALNPTTNTNPPHNFFGSYFYIDDVSITPVPPSIVADVPTTCIASGTAVELTASGSPGYNWSWTDSGGPHSSIGSILNVTPTETTTYTVTADLDCNKCGDIENTYTITIAPSAVISGGGSICTTGSSEISVAITGGAVPWTIVYNDGTNDITVTGITSSPYTFDAINPGTYTLVSVSDAGAYCTGNVSGSAVVSNSGCACGSTLGSTTWGSGYTLAPGFYASTGNITVNGNVTLTDVILTMPASAIITINNGATLTLDHSHIYACGNMWLGIIVNPGGILNITDGTLIEDAELAVYISTPNSSTTLAIDNAIFNRNMDAVFIDDYQSTASTTYTNFDIKNTVFTCRTIPYSSTWPTVAALQTLTSTGTLAEHYTVGGYATTTLKAPFATDISNSGITLLSVGTLSGGTYYEMLIEGNNGSTTFNLFDNMLYGINASNSNFTCHNNIFQYIKSASSTMGIGINATDAGAGYTTNNRLRVTSTGTNTSNRFYDCSTGINAENYNDVTINYTDMRSTQMPVSTLPVEGELGIGVNTPNCTQITVDNNIITNIRTGIVFNADAVAYGGYTNAQNIGPVGITNNTIQANYSGVTLSDEYALTGIVANNLITYTNYALTAPTPYAINVSDNHLYDVHNGVSMSKWVYIWYTPTIGAGNSAVATNNYIKLREQTYPNSGITQVGAYHTANCGNWMVNNNIQGFGKTQYYWLGMYSASFTLYNAVELINCNLTENVGIGAYLINDHGHISFEKNTMESTKYGLMLDNATIGQQGDATNASDNEWTGSYPSGTFTTFTTNGTDVTQSPLYVQSGAPYDPATVGTCSSTTPTFTNTVYSFTYNSLVSSSGASGLSCDALPTARLAGNDSEYELFSTNADISKLERMVTNTVDYGIFPAEQYLNAQHKVYRLLNLQPDLKDSSTILLNFYNGQQSHNIKKLAQIENGLAQGNLHQAQALLSTITADNTIENHYKNYYTAYVHFKQRACTAADSLALWQLVTGCAAKDGEIVYQARSLYSMLYRDYTPRIDVCVDSITQTLKKAQLTTVVNTNNKQTFTVYPNPSIGEVWLKFERVPDNKVEINVYSIEGILVHSEKTADTKINHNFSNGIYFIHVKTSDGYQYSPQRVTIIN